MLNRVILIGRPTKNPELRYTPNGTPVAKFTLAVNRPYRDKQSNNLADFINIVAWRKLGELCAQYLSKGQLAAVEGRLEIRTYEDNHGNKQQITEVIADNVRFLESAKKNDTSEDASDEKDDEEPLPF